MISKLPATVSQQVCASQVITDLSSCIKQLVENSIDAGAQFIRVTLENYGKTKIEVFDDGCGIAREGLGRVCEKGATSKLGDWEEVNRVGTLGFRGEALNALRNVSVLEIETKTSEDISGWTLLLQSPSQPPQPKHVSYPHGTRITITSLFKSLPVRQKHWHTHCRQQLLKLCQLLKQYSLSYIQVQFILISEVQGKTQCLFESAINRELVDRREKWLRRVEAVLGRNIAECLEWVEDRNVQGWVSRQLLGKGNTQTVIKRNMLFMYLNSRPVDFMRGLQKAIEELYKEWNSFNKYLVIINIKLPSNSADISSTPDKRHLFTKLQPQIIEQVKRKITQLMERLYFRPKKMESQLQTKIKQRRSQGGGNINRVVENVRMQRKEFVQQPEKKVDGSVKERFNAFRGSNVSQKEEKIEGEEVDRRRSDTTNLRVNRVSYVSKQQEYQGKVTIKENTKLLNERVQDEQIIEKEMIKQQKVQPQKQQQSKLHQIDFEPPKNFLKDDFREVDILGQFNRGFIVCFYRNEFYIIDQHAASQKTNYQNLLRLPPTHLHLPKSLKLSPEDLTFIEQNCESLRSFGYIFEVSSYEVKFSAFPRILGCVFDEKSFVELAKTEAGLKRPERHPMVRREAAMAACHMSVRVGDVLGMEEMRELVGGLGGLDSPWNCPHGRPTIVKLVDVRDSMEGISFERVYQL